jgi:hypothetical protein
MAIKYMLYRTMNKSRVFLPYLTVLKSHSKNATARACAFRNRKVGIRLANIALWFPWMKVPVCVFSNIVSATGRTVQTLLHLFLFATCICIYLMPCNICLTITTLLSGGKCKKSRRGIFRIRFLSRTPIQAR